MIKKVLIISMFIAIIIMSIGLFNIPIEKKYTVYSESICQGHTCRDYLLSQMYFKNITIIKLEKPNICDISNWSDCNDKYKIQIVEDI